MFSPSPHNGSAELSRTALLKLSFSVLVLLSAESCSGTLPSTHAAETCQKCHEVPGVIPCGNIVFGK